MSARSRDLLSAALIGAGIVGAGELHFACAASTNADGAYWKDWFDREKYFTGANAITSGHAAMGSGRNDVLFLGSAAGISTTATITWSNNLCHIVGMDPSRPGQRSNRARVNPSGNFTPIWTISGYGNTFSNMAFNHGNSSSANTNLISITGARNWFQNCHFACYTINEMQVAAYSLISLGDCSEVGFKDCYMGSDSVAMASGQMLEYTSNTTIRALYDNCNFVMNSTAAAALFIHVKPGAGKGTSIFKNTMFLNNSATALTLAIAASGMVNTGHQFYFDSNSAFAGVTDICAAANEGTCMFHVPGIDSSAGSGGAFHGIMQAFDHTSG
ncbi:MAG: hypothetical protein ACYSUC_12910 [Planctomycetota bacterium]|jgi:hypothetical protein